MNNKYIPPFKDLFKEYIEYPNLIDIVQEGFNNETLYKYVATTLLNAFVNVPKIFYTVVIERYENFNKKNKEQYLESTGDYSKFDNDVLLLGETEHHYWLFYSDRDTSDCMFGICSKWDKYEDKIEYEEFIKSVKEEFKLDNTKEDIIIPDGHEQLTGKYFELPKAKFWIKL